VRRDVGTMSNDRAEMRPLQRRPSAVRVRSSSTLAFAMGAAAGAAVAMGALAIGYVAIGRLRVRAARIDAVEIDDLTVRRLHILQQRGVTP
jgi:hypothetical protein